MAYGHSLPPAFRRGIVTTVYQGDCLISADADVTLSTLLGSCVAACVRDVEARVGGMNHFLLAQPSGTARDRFGASARYGAFAMEELINKVLGAGTGRKANLEVKVFGGGLITEALSDVGAQNIAFVREFLHDEGYALASEDLGGAYARRLMFKPESGLAIVKRLDSPAGNSIARDELALARGPAVARPNTGDIELF